MHIDFLHLWFHIHAVTVVFEYRLEHISEEISQEEKMKEKRVLSEVQ